MVTNYNTGKYIHRENEIRTEKIKKKTFLGIKCGYRGGVLGENQLGIGLLQVFPYTTQCGIETKYKTIILICKFT